MTLPYLLIVTDGVRIRSIHSPAMPADLAKAIEDYIATDLVERDVPTTPAPQPDPSGPLEWDAPPPPLGSKPAGFDRGVQAGVPVPDRDRVSKIGEAKSKGFVGIMCQAPGCGSFNTKHNGHCLVCDDCGETTGCS